MTFKSIFITGAAFGLLAVALGAFGAHGLRTVLEANGRQETFELAVRYQFYHCLAIMFCAVLLRLGISKWMDTAALFFILGVIVFSGSLYALALSGMTKLGMITPIGGLCFLIGWALLVAGVARSK